MAGVIANEGGRRPAAAAGGPRFGPAYHRSSLDSLSNPIRRLGRRLLGTATRPVRLLRRIRELPPGSRILDLGCGLGGFLESVREIRPDLELWRLDVDEPGRPMPDGIRFRLGSALELPFEGGSFSAITAFHLLEHFSPSEASRALAEARRALEPRGVLYVETPSVRAIFYNFYSDPTHVRPYDRAGLTKLLETNGFAPEKVGVVRDLRILIAGLPYCLAGRLTGDRRAAESFISHLAGLAVYAIARPAGGEGG